MSEIYVCFSKSKIKMPIMGRLIELFQDGFSHCSIYFCLESTKNWYAVDSTSKGVKAHNLSNFKDHHSILKSYKIPSSELQKVEILKKVIDKSYNKYPMSEVIGNLVQIILRPVGIRVRNPFRNGDEWPRCNELVSILLRDVYGFPMPKDLDSTDLLWLNKHLSEVLE